MLNKMFGKLWWKYCDEGKIDNYKQLPLLGKIGFKGWLYTTCIKTHRLPKDFSSVKMYTM